MKPLVSAIFIVQALVGCAWLQPAAVPAPTPDAPIAARHAEFLQEGQEVLALLAYYQSLASMPADELRREYQTVSQNFVRDKSELSRLRLGFLMSMPGAPWRDESKLQTLLDGSASRSAPPESPRRQLLLLLQKQSSERLREQRRADDLQRRVDEQQRRADEQLRRADDLQQKLDAMLNIERSLRREIKKP